MVTCYPERGHHHQTEDAIDDEGPGHLSDGVAVPPPVFLDLVDPSVPVPVGEGHVEAQDDVEELVKVAAPGPELLRGEDLNKTQCQELQQCHNKEAAEGGGE